MHLIRNSLVIGASIALLILLSHEDYLLFHSLAELFSIVIAFGIFVIGWNSRKYYRNNYLLFIGIAYAFVAGFDTLHTLAYKGLTIFKGFDDNNLPPQLWLVARSFEAISLLVAPHFFSRSLNYRQVVGCFAAASVFALYAIFDARVFPVCFLAGSGLTPFKVAAEYLIDVVLLVSLFLLYRNREHFEPATLRLLTLSIFCTMVTELCFTVYVHLYGLSNMVGHVFKIFSFYFMYKAIIETALVRPYDLLFRDLKKSEEELRIERNQLQKVLDELRVLKGILPICSYCKKIRSDEGAWTQMEAYIRDHSEAEFSHGICPACAEGVLRSFVIERGHDNHDTSIPSFH